MNLKKLFELPMTPACDKLADAGSLACADHHDAIDATLSLPSLTIPSISFFELGKTR